jgi:flagellar hook-length control protein FliK
MRLHPPELGSLRIELQLQDGQLHARLQTETSEARTLIMDNLPILKERLAEQNIRVERFDVDLFDPTGQQPQQSGSEFSRENQPKATRQKTHNSSPAIREELPTSSQNSQHLNAKNINVII